MKTTLVVLWLYSAAGFGIGPITFGPGWYATKNIFSSEFMNQCATLGMEMAGMSASMTNWGCFLAGDGPPEEEWAKVRR